MINKSDSRCAVVRFCYHSYDYRLNWTPLSPITITNRANIEIPLYLVNKEDTTVFCFVVKQAGSGRARTKWRGKHQTKFLSALPLPKCFTTEHRTVEASLFALWLRIQSFPHAFGWIFNQTFFSKRVNMAPAALSCLIKHTKRSQSQSFLELFK